MKQSWEVRRACVLWESKLGWYICEGTHRMVHSSWGVQGCQSYHSFFLLKVLSFAWTLSVCSPPFNNWPLLKLFLCLQCPLYCPLSVQFIILATALGIRGLSSCYSWANRCFTTVAEFPPGPWAVRDGARLCFWLSDWPQWSIAGDGWNAYFLPSVAQRGHQLSPPLSCSWSWSLWNSSAACSWSSPGGPCGWGTASRSSSCSSTCCLYQGPSLPPFQWAWLIPQANYFYGAADAHTGQAQSQSSCLHLSSNVSSGHQRLSFLIPST